MANWARTRGAVHRAFPAFISREARGEGLGDGEERLSIQVGGNLTLFLGLCQYLVDTGNFKGSVQSVWSSPLSVEWEGVVRFPFRARNPQNSWPCLNIHVLSFTLHCPVFPAGLSPGSEPPAPL